MPARKSQPPNLEDVLAGLKSVGGELQRDDAAPSGFRIVWRQRGVEDSLKLAYRDVMALHAAEIRERFGWLTEDEPTQEELREIQSVFDEMRSRNGS